MRFYRKNSLYQPRKRGGRKIESPSSIVILIVMFFSILLTGCSKLENNQVNENKPEALIAQLDHHIPRMQNQYDVPGVSIALIQKGELVWSNAYGYADLEQNKRMTVNSICRAESISKSVTAWGVMQLVDEGLIDLDDPVEKYLDEWSFPMSEFDTQQVTIRRLLSANAGLPLGTIGEAAEYSPNSPMPSLKDSLSEEANLIKEPGSGFLYSNPGFNLLELLIESVTKQDFAIYMENEILTPLGMSEASFSWEEQYENSLPLGYELLGEPVYPYIYPVKASGGLFSNVEDLARFVSAGMTGPNAKNQVILSEKSINLIQTPQVDIPGLFGFVADSYGFGVFIETLSNGQKAIWHGGQGHGWMTHFHFIPESGTGIVILSNSQRSWPLIAGILSDWTAWNGLPPVKFSRIQQATIGMKILSVLIILLGFQQLYHLMKRIFKGTLRFAPFEENWDLARSLKAITSIGLIIIIIWSAFQPYLFLSSIFPSTVYWAGGGLFGLAIVILVSTLFIKVENK